MKKLKNKGLYSGILLIILIGAILLFIPIESNSKKTEKTSSGSEKVVETSDTSSSSEKSKSEKEPKTRDGAVVATTSMLKEFHNSPVEGLSLEDRMSETKKDDYDLDKIFSKDGWNKIRLVDFMESDPRGKLLTAQSILSILKTIEDSDNSDLKATEVDYSGVVYFDEDRGIAEVPVDLYTNVVTNLSFEMAYVNDEWVLQPYSLLSQIAIRNLDQANSNVSSSTEDSTETNDESTESSTVE